MKNTERFSLVMDGNGTPDRLPVIEWASWWDETCAAWYRQGLPAHLSGNALNDHFGHDRLRQFWLPVRDKGCPQPKFHGGPIIEDEGDYDAVRPHLFTDRLLGEIDETIRAQQAADDGDTAYWFTLEGFFWFPRTLFGIEGHLFAFYDYPELMLRINRDLAEYHRKCLEVVYSRIKPHFMTFAEDMSYNLGPMLSREQYDAFMLPFYRNLVPEIRRRGTKVLIDTDGQVEPLIPWFLEGGIEGILPLERMAGVDVNRIREHYPDLIMIGGFDKTVMHRGEAAMRTEFERLLPAMRAGRYIPSVDHQTPPDVSLENYHIFLALLREYAKKAVTDMKIVAEKHRK